MITLTIRVKLILKAFGYTATILVGAFIFAQFVWAATGSGDLGGLAFWGGIFLGILAVLTDELRKCEALLTQHTHERTAVVASSHTPELTAYALGTHQVSTATSIDLNVDIFDLHVGVRTDVERSKCVRSQHVPTHTPGNQITQDRKEAHIMTVTAPSMRFSTARSASAVYYAGYDPGSRIASLYLCAEDRPDELELSLSVPSIIGDGNVADLVNVRATTDPNAPLASLLKKREYVLEYEGQDYYVGELAEKEGKNATTAHGASDRYWSRHSLLLLLALAAILIPEQKSELRVVTALPVTLYRTKENRSLVKRTLEGWYPFRFNGRDREIIVKVGAVVMEGMGALIQYGEETGKQAVIDIGERTIDLVAADGQTPLSNLCDGDILGVGQIADELIREIKGRYKRILSSIEAHEQLYAYANSKPLPRLAANQQPIPADEIRGIIDKAIARVGRAITLYIAQKWNQEGGAVASNFSPVLLIGGGAYYFEQAIKSLIPLVDRPEDPEDANPRGYLDLALSLEDVKATIWERN